MVSSTFLDLTEYRSAVIKALAGQSLTPVAMDNDGAKLIDVIDSSLKMVQDAAAYVGIIGKRYGQIPKCPVRNPDGLSITELEFNEAVRLGRPILLFIMGKDHLVREDYIESSVAKKKKLRAFIDRAKRIAPDSSVHRVYAVFESLEEFREKISASITELRRHLDAQAETSTLELTLTKGPLIPKPPSLYAEPDYIGSHNFVGRASELDALCNWTLPADPHTILLFEGIGGNGKSMLTWEWAKHHATKVRPDWAGRFWYSFYEKGAVMSDFCQRALAYMTGQPLDLLRKKKTTELASELLHQLHGNPWLLILDGLERVLVAYHRIDAAEVPDEDANCPSDKIGDRDPCAAIRDEDDDLLRSLAAAEPSKILISSRLIPRILLNSAGQTIPGVLHIALQGLRPPDAYELLHSCGVTGDPAEIQNYLTANCDCHPLVIGVLAGLINDYLPDKGNFDAWSADPKGGGQLNLASLDLIQRRNHILRTALAALSPKAGQLLSTLALLSESVDYSTLKALNPHIPMEPKEVPKPERHRRMSESEMDKYNLALLKRQEYERAVNSRLQSPEYASAPNELAKTVRDLERRGLLQYDARSKRYDLHPVVRGIAAGGLRVDERESYGQRVLDHFSRQSHNPYEEAESLDDVSDGLNLVRTLIRMKRFQQAADAYLGDLSHALLFNIEAYSETLSLLKPFFPAGWGKLPSGVSEIDGSYLANEAAIALRNAGEPMEALAANSAAIQVDLDTKNWDMLDVRLYNVCRNLVSQNLLAKVGRVNLLLMNLATVRGESESFFSSQLFNFSFLAKTGKWVEAEATWSRISPMSRGWSRSAYRPGSAEWLYAQFQFWRGQLQEELLVRVERLANEAKNRNTLRELYGLRGAWYLEQGEWGLAATNLQQAVRMARERGITDVEAETGLTLAKFHLGQLADPAREAMQLGLARKPAARRLASLWLAIGDRERATTHALAAYEWAQSEGEPYVWRHELNKAAELLKQLNVPTPTYPDYDPAHDEKFRWEDSVAAAIENLRVARKYGFAN